MELNFTQIKLKLSQIELKLTQIELKLDLTKSWSSQNEV